MRSLSSLEDSRQWTWFQLVQTFSIYRTKPKGGDNEWHKHARAALAAAPARAVEHRAGAHLAEPALPVGRPDVVPPIAAPRAAARPDLARQLVVRHRVAAPAGADRPATREWAANLPVWVPKPECNVEHKCSKTSMKRNPSVADPIG